MNRLCPPPSAARPRPCAPPAAPGARRRRSPRAGGTAPPAIPRAPPASGRAAAGRTAASPPARQPLDRVPATAEPCGPCPLLPEGGSIFMSSGVSFRCRPTRAARVPSLHRGATLGPCEAVHQHAVLVLLASTARPAFGPPCARVGAHGVPSGTPTVAPYRLERDPRAIPEAFRAPRIGFEPWGREAVSGGPREGHVSGAVWCRRCRP